MGASAPPEPVELTRDIVRDLHSRAEQRPALYVIRHGQPTWVTVSCEGVIANIQPEIIEPCEGGWRVASLP